jgi:hypothetical protein
MDKTVSHEVRRVTSRSLAELTKTVNYEFFEDGGKSFPGVKRPGRGVNHPPPFITEVKERVELPLCAFMACFLKLSRYRPEQAHGRSGRLRLRIFLTFDTRRW